MSSPADAEERAAGVSPAEAMDRIYGRQRYIYDATRKYFLLGRDRLIRDLAPPPGGAILEIGCGTGRNLLAAARHYPDARFFGIDISAMMLTTARAHITRAGLDQRIALARGDAAAFDAAALFGRATFDRVFLSYSASMIPDWRAALASALSLATPAEGRLLVVDFGRQEQLPNWFGSMLSSWLERFEVKPRYDLEETLNGLASPKDRVSFEPLFRGYAAYGQLSRVPQRGDET